MMGSLEFVLSVIGVCITTASLLYAVMANRDKARVEKSLKAHLGSTAGNIILIRKNSETAHKHIYNILSLVKEAQPDTDQIAEYAAWAQSDVTASDRTLEILLADILSLQEGLFGTRDIPSAPPRLEDLGR